MVLTKALLGGGCFWGIEEYYRNISGVINTTAGYSGGNIANPSYKEVCTDTTGHAEVVMVEFDDKILSYSEIIDYFWICHDPSQLNKQGPDIGTQYRSIIFCYTDEQKIIAEKSKEKFQKKNICFYFNDY